MCQGLTTEDEVESAADEGLTALCVALTAAAPSVRIVVVTSVNGAF